MLWNVGGEARDPVHHLALVQFLHRRVQLKLDRSRSSRRAACHQQPSGQRQAGQPHATVRSSSAWPTEVADVEAMTTRRTVAEARGSVNVACPVMASVGMPAVHNADLPASVTAS